MKITHLSAECMPFAKTGGLGDVAAALPRAQAAAGNDVEVWLPFHLPAAQWYRRHHSWPELGCEPLDIDIYAPDGSRAAPGQTYTTPETCFNTSTRAATATTAPPAATPGEAPASRSAAR